MPEHTSATVPAQISFHQVINALQQLAPCFPLERLSYDQVQMIREAADILQERLDEVTHAN
jgi:hypothetical protein